MSRRQSSSKDPYVFVAPTFIQWLTTFRERIFVPQEMFRRLLFKYQVNPLFVLMIGFPNTGGASSSFNYVGDKPESFHLCLRYPSVSLSIHFALYFQFNFATRKVFVMILDGDIENTQSHVGGNLQEIAREHAYRYQSNTQRLHPFVYALPLLQHVGNLTDHIRNECRDEMVDLEQHTGTSVYGEPIGENILNQESHARDIETWTRKAHICGAKVAESQKYLRVHLRGVQEFFKGFYAFQQRYYTYCGMNSAQCAFEAERVEDLLRLELDTCQGRQMELDNLSKRVDIQINMLFSLASQRDSRVNTRIAEETKRIAEESQRIAEESKRIAEESKRIGEESKRIGEESKHIATETKKDSSSMKTIAALTMVFLPGTFVSVSAFSTAMVQTPVLGEDGGSFLLLQCLSLW
ncbi:hypothetical protein K440DRAFT_642060 [Wilcoxina mikolae CBS 423.85]|nr:hypothetical protein K440DRAFT_642060 [Wilcoxina mikolae CBS 423.85]